MVQDFEICNAEFRNTLDETYETCQRRIG